MRIYRLQIRIIQLAVLLSVIIMAYGMVSIWRGNTEGQPVTGDNIVQNDSGDQTPGTSQDDANGDSGLENGETINKKIVFLGDSYTFGYPGAQKDSWPARVAEVLNIEAVNAGVVHQNAADLLARFEQDVAAKDPGRVVIFAGVGDAIRATPLDEYQASLKALVAKAEANQIKPVLALPIPFPGTEQLYKQYREWEIAYAQEKNILVLDFKDTLFGSENKMLRKYSDDGEYPNKNGYQAMGDYAATILQ